MRNPLCVHANEALWAAVAFAIFLSSSCRALLFTDAASAFRYRPLSKGQCKDRGGCATLRVSSTLIARWNAGC